MVLRIIVTEHSNYKTISKMLLNEIVCRYHVILNGLVRYFGSFSSVKGKVMANMIARDQENVWLTKGLSETS